MVPRLARHLSPGRAGQPWPGSPPPCFSCSTAAAFVSPPHALEKDKLLLVSSSSNLVGGDKDPRGGPCNPVQDNLAQHENKTRLGSARDISNTFYLRGCRGG